MRATNAGLLLAVGFGLLWRPAPAWGYSTSQVKDQTTTGQNLSFQFTGLPLASSNVAVEVSLVGDYSTVAKMAVTTIDGSAQPPIFGAPGYTCLTSQARSATFAVAAANVSDHALDVLVDLSDSVGVCSPFPSRVTVTVTYTAMPELRMSSWTGTTSAAGSGSSVANTFSVRNDGDLASGAFVVAISYGDTASPSGLTQLGVLSFPSIAAAATASVSGSFTLPANVLSGSRYLHSFVDSALAVTESDETNNRNSRALTITGQPDLQVPSLSVSPTSVSPGTAVTLTFEVTNMGSTRATAPFPVNLYYSPDATITTADTLIATHTVTNDVGASSLAGEWSVAATIPASATSGTRYVGAIVDPAGAVAEGNESNNTRSASVAVTAVPNLAFSTLSHAVSVQGLGSILAVSWAVANNGTGPSAACSLTFSYGDSTAASGLIPLATTSVPALAAGANTSVVQTNLPIPGTVLAGSRALHVQLDSAGEVAESNESDNQVVRSLTISGQPDLQVSALTVSPASQVPGGALAVGYRLFNGGYSRIPSQFATRFYYSDDVTLSTSDVYLGQEVVVSALPAGSYDPAAGNGSLSAALPATATAGTRYLGAIANWDGSLVEGSTVNNTRSAAVTVLVPLGKACTGSADCAGGPCVDGRCCDGACGNGATDDCQACSVTAGALADGFCSPRAGGALCRASAGGCDPAETCSGGTDCPADLRAPAGTVCHPSTGGCDPAETCGGGPDCPTDLLSPVGTVCHAAAGACDVAETCDGSAACPADAVVARGTVCNPSRGDCDPAETCDGNAPTCPADALLPAGTPCRDADGACDLAETCDGNAPACPADAFMAAGTECRAAAACDVAETCAGGADCPADVLAADGTACAGSGQCAQGRCNHAPAAADDAYELASGQTLDVLAIDGVLANDSDPDGDSIGAVATAQPQHGTLTLEASGSFRLEPAAGFSGEDSFRYRATDGLLASAEATVTLTVIGPDAGTPGLDAGAVTPDAATSAWDASETPSDASEIAWDGSGSSWDASESAEDASLSAWDATASSADAAATAAEDASGAAGDAAAQEADAGEEPLADSGQARVDSGQASAGDGGSVGVDAGSSGAAETGCGCGVAPAPASGLGLLALLLARRRRR